MKNEYFHQLFLKRKKVLVYQSSLMREVGFETGGWGESTAKC